MKKLLNYIQNGDYIAVCEGSSGNFAGVVMIEHIPQIIYDYGNFEAIPENFHNLPILANFLACGDAIGVITPDNPCYLKFVRELEGDRAENFVTTDEFDLFVDFNINGKIRLNATQSLVKKITSFNVISELAIDIYDTQSKKTVTKYINTCEFTHAQEQLIKSEQIAIVYRAVNGIVDDTQFFLKNGNGAIRQYPISELDNYAWLANYAITIEVSGNNSQYNFGYFPAVRFLANVHGLRYGFASPVLNYYTNADFSTILRLLAGDIED